MIKSSWFFVKFKYAEKKRTDNAKCHFKSRSDACLAHSRSVWCGWMLLGLWLDSLVVGGLLRETGNPFLSCHPDHSTTTRAWTLRLLWLKPGHSNCQDSDNESVARDCRPSHQSSSRDRLTDNPYLPLSAFTPFQPVLSTFCQTAVNWQLFHFALKPGVDFWDCLKTASAYVAW
ncbi:hypothetical protein JZ751_002372 [Albula glossodonta]|uniref:Uncharacterized protein n=1 Tax=Albula glossodonta TaxID=121402 RepID=A0A8T2PG60_9TELE|nr:hypothetical protein JZ751_002372 [Albula glossodonta]